MTPNLLKNCAQELAAVVQKYSPSLLGTMELKTLSVKGAYEVLITTQQQDEEKWLVKLCLKGVVPTARGISLQANVAKK